jgi:hypothetical protein
MKMGEMEVLLSIANLIHRFQFSWSPSKKEDKNRLQCVLGLDSSLKDPAMATITKRQSSQGAELIMHSKEMF